MIFDEESTNAMLLTDADRMVLRSFTISGIYAHQCVAIYTVCHHAYLYLEQLNFIIRRDHKGRGSPPPTMPVYAIGIIPLLKIIKPKTPEDITMKHVAFAGELLELRRWWDTIGPWGPNVGT